MDRTGGTKIIDSRTLQSAPESGTRAAFDGAEKRKGSKVHAAVDRGYAEDAIKEAAAPHDIGLDVVKHHKTKRELILLPRR